MLYKMDHILYIVDENEHEDFTTMMKLGKYIQEHRNEIVWKGGFYPRLEDTVYRGTKAFMQIIKNIGGGDLKTCTKFLKLLRHEYFVDGKYFRTNKKEIAESIFSDDERIYIGEEENSKEDKEDNVPELINIIDEVELSSEEIKQLINHLVEKL